MLLKRLTLTMATSLLALAGTVGTATAAPAPAANTGDQSGPCYINIQGSNNTNTYASCGQILTGTGHVTGSNHTVGRGGLTGADTLPQVGVETSNLLAAPQDNADVIAPLTGGTNVSAACTLLSPVGDGVFYLVVTTVNGYPTAGWLPAEVVSSTADVPACLPT
ncbi:hypothetical protein ACF063_11820 [Streptomyces chartreusis]|uniref:hypothetical protein n=1 Tax=Streptomyces TaxID=1883 RepID=UPI000F741717|nr:MULTISPECIES: hypothetical protein [Streptomyces]RSN85987.1 hypothetical protein DMH26_33515 [Streptomyces sp. WAC 05379]